MATHVERLLDLADALIDDHPRSTAAKRRAVSSAYYATFHALMEFCADTLMPAGDRTSVEYERVYRALDHGSLKNAFLVKDSPLRNNRALSRIGDLVVPSQSARMQADYAPPKPNFYEAGQPRNFVSQAREVVALLDTLSPEDGLTLAVHLIFKDRSR